VILVAILALLLGAGIGAVGLVRRARHFRPVAARHAASADFFVSQLALDEQTLFCYRALAERTHAQLNRRTDQSIGCTPFESFRVTPGGLVTFFLPAAAFLRGVGAAIEAASFDSSKGIL
jgi:hypothetical protein